VGVRPDGDRPLGELEGVVELARARRQVAAEEGEVAVGIRLALGADEALGARLPGGGDRVLALVADEPGDVGRDVRGADRVALLDVALVGAFLDLGLDVGTGDEERREGERLEVRGGGGSGAVRLAEPVERLLPGVARGGGSPVGEGVGRRCRW
jgi:hypothetical protein